MISSPRRTPIPVTGSMACTSTHSTPWSRPRAGGTSTAIAGGTADAGDTRTVGEALAGGGQSPGNGAPSGGGRSRSEEHTSELQSRGHLVCRLLLEKKQESGIAG